jgi:hypothetical protein
MDCGEVGVIGVINVIFRERGKASTAHTLAYHEPTN